MTILLENTQPEAWYFWLGEKAYDRAPYFYVVPAPIEGEFNMLPGGVTFVETPKTFRWWWPV